jgi:hypothetical protein
MERPRGRDSAARHADDRYILAPEIRLHCASTLQISYVSIIDVLDLKFI